ncbi:MAG: 3-ketoacyl-ACP reductase [Pirellulales bacterium]
MAKHDKRVALITGGTRGIGLGIARRLAESGFDLAINGRRESSDVAEALASLESQGANVAYCRGDIALAAERDAIVDAVRTRFGRLDVLINNAGIAPEQREDILQAGEESFDRIVKVNLQGPYFLTQRVANWMIEQHRADAEYVGAIVNVSSVSATVVSVNRGDYCISKAGIAMATQLWAVRLAEHGIAVYEVRPGIIRTDMTAVATERYDEIIGRGETLEPRWGTPDDVGRAVAVLARGELSYATGSVLMVDGGLTVRRL